MLNLKSIFKHKGKGQSNIAQRVKDVDFTVPDPKSLNFSFDKWFEGSKVSDQEGKPLMVFHGTRHNFKRFLPLSHFGSSKAAHTNVGLNPKPEVGEKLDRWDEGKVFHPVLLRLKNPLVQKDLGGHNIYNYESDLQRRGLVKKAACQEMDKDSIFYQYSEYEDKDNKAARKEMDKDPIFPEKYRTPENLWKQRMIKELEAQGYDGIIYRNECEDAGSVSYIIFRPEQVMPAYLVDSKCNRQFSKYVSSCTDTKPLHTPHTLKNSPAL